MNINQAFPSKYLKADDLKGRTFRLPITRIVAEQIRPGEPESERVIAYFQGASKGMVLNKTNAMELGAAWGPETDTWIGKTVELFSMHVQYQGRPVLGLRLRPVAVQTKEGFPPFITGNGGQQAPQAIQQGLQNINQPLPSAPELSTADVDAWELDDSIPF